MINIVALERLKEILTLQVDNLWVIFMSIDNQIKLFLSIPFVSTSVRNVGFHLHHDFLPLLHSGEKIFYFPAISSTDSKNLQRLEVARFRLRICSYHQWFLWDTFCHNLNFTNHILQTQWVVSHLFVPQMKISKTWSLHHRLY